MVNVDKQVDIPYIDPMGYDSAFNHLSDHYLEKLKKHDPYLTGADVFDIGWAEQKHQLLGSEIPFTEVLRFSLHVFTGVSKTIAKKRIYGIGRLTYICRKDQVDIGKYTPLKSNIATQNDAIHV